MTEVEKRKVEILFIRDEERDTVQTWLFNEFDIFELVDGFMWSAVSLLRKNDFTDEEIPDIIRESLRGAMMGESERYDTREG